MSHSVASDLGLQSLPITLWGLQTEMGEARFSNEYPHSMFFLVCLRLYGPINPMGSCQAQSVFPGELEKIVLEI